MNFWKRWRGVIISITVGLLFMWTYTMATWNDWVFLVGVILGAVAWTWPFSKKELYDQPLKKREMSKRSEWAFFLGVALVFIALVTHQI